MQVTDPQDFRRHRGHLHASEHDCHSGHYVALGPTHCSCGRPFELRHRRSGHGLLLAPDAQEQGAAATPLQQVGFPGRLRLEYGAEEGGQTTSLPLMRLVRTDRLKFLQRNGT